MRSTPAPVLSPMLTRPEPPRDFATSLRVRARTRATAE
ncbi:Uncharacterised protein [Mycobacteroides abscessus]|nr:Uncharacterised protein [Mycobacteroides abscessus]